MWVRLIFLPDELRVEIEDHGSGFAMNQRRGIGLVAMRERAELLSGTIEFLQPETGGTLVRLKSPRDAAPKDKSPEQPSPMETDSHA